PEQADPEHVAAVEVDAQPGERLDAERARRARARAHRRLVADVAVAAAEDRLDPALREAVAKLDLDRGLADDLADRQGELVLLRADRDVEAVGPAVAAHVG